MYHENQQQKPNVPQQHQIALNSPAADPAAMAAYYAQLQQIFTMINQQQQTTQSQQPQIRLSQSVTSQSGGFNNISSPSLLQQQQQSSYLNLLRLRQQPEQQLNSPQSTPQIAATPTTTRILTMLQPNLQQFDNSVNLFLLIKF